MAFTRNEAADWAFYDAEHGSDPTVGMVIVGDVLYFNSSGVGPSKIKGLNIADGSLVSTLTVDAFGSNKTYAPFLLADQNGYLWVQTFSSPAGYAVYDPIAGGSAVATPAYPPEGLVSVFDPVNNIMWLSRNTGKVTPVSSVTYAAGTDITVTSARAIGMDTDKGELWVRDSPNVIRVFDAATGTPILTRTTSQSTNNTGGELDYVPEKKWMIVTAYGRYTEVWSTDTYELVATLYSTGSTSQRLIKYYVPAFDSIGGSNTANPKWELIDTNLVSQFLDTPLLPNLVPNTTAIVGSDSSIYLAGYSFGQFYIYKVAFEAPPASCFHVGVMGAAGRCAGTATGIGAYSREDGAP